MMRIINRFILVILGSLLALIGVEICLRIFNYQTPPLHWSSSQSDRSIFRTDKNRIYAVKHENIFNRFNQFWSSDELGMRYSSNHQYNELQIKETIIAVGDSFTYGHGVKNSEAYPYVLENFFRKNGDKVVVHNAGVPGYGLDQEFLYIKDDLLKRFKPSALIWNINHNDLTDSNLACLFTKSKSGWKQINSLWQNSLYFEGRLVQLTPSWLNQSKIFNLVATAPKSFAGQERFTFGCSKKDIEYHKKLELMDDKFGYFLSEIIKITDEKNIKLLVVMVPFQRYFDDEDFEADFGSRHAYYLMKETVNDFEVNFLDMNVRLVKRYDLDLFTLREGREKVAQIKRDSDVLSAKSINLHESIFLDEEGNFYSNHLNKLGNQLMAEEVFQEVKSILK